MHLRDFGCIYRLLNIYLSHIYKYTCFRARKFSVFFDIEDTAAATSFGGQLHKEGKLAKLQTSLLRLLHCLISSYQGLVVGVFWFGFFSELNCIQE